MRTTPWTITRHVRDWISCFLACRFPTDDEPDHRYCNSNPPLAKKNNMSFEYSKTNLTRCKKGDTTRWRKPAAGSGQEVANSSYNKDMITQPNEERSDEDSMRSNYSGDEGYIVFSFREDGAFEVLKHGNSDEASSNHLHSASRNSKPVNRKLNYEGNTKGVFIERCRSKTYPTNYDDCIIPHQKEPEEENIYLDAQSDDGANFEEHAYGVASDESRDSTHSSNASTSSFAFPALGWEWIGSPRKMPSSEGLSLRKHKARCVGFCKF